jgi:hypothetical protein
LRVRQFAINRDAYHAPAYKEAHARQEFIDPLFAALGWDVHNSQRLAPDYREVVIEDSVDIEGQKKAPDYVFRVGRERKFFAEAKKPGVDLKKDAAPAYQLRRYAWTAKLPLSVLTDFEVLATYDCRSRPSANDKPSVGRVSYFNYIEYADRWREIWDVYSREAVWGGSFDQFALSSKGKRGTSEVDTEFLKEIEGWREALARNLALRNSHLGIDELNDAVQRTIDRIIFLRLTEDRGIEDYGRLRRLAEGEDIYCGLVKLFRNADAKYNSGLFDFSREGDRLTPGLSVDDKTLTPILADLYYPRSPYEFSVLPVEILGNVYEQFLGKVVRLTAGHQAKVEEKPEVKKAGGVYYTPVYIVKYIVQNTIGNLVAGKSPLQLRGLRVVDPACGSGSFLLGAYNYLLDYYQQWYTANAPEKYPRAVWLAGEAWRLTGAEKKRINLLAVLENETGEDAGKQLALLPEQAKERVLPNLDRNIKCGNSLIGPDYFAGQLLPDEAELRRVNPFDWQREFPEAMKAGGFDCVIGNPPYVRIQTMKEWAPLEVEAYKQLFTSARVGNYDIYIVFIEKALDLINKNGRVGFILPSKFFATDYGEALRSIITQRRSLAAVVDFGHAQVFANATTYTCLLFLSGSLSSKYSYVKIASPSAISLATTTPIQADSASLSAQPWLFSNDLEKGLSEKLLENSKPLGELPARIARGSSSGADDIFMLRPQGKRIVTRQDEVVDIEPSILRRPIYATDYGRFEFRPNSGEVIIFPYDVTTEGYELKSEAELRKSYPKAYNYLLTRKKALEARKQFKTWYSFSAPRNLEVHDIAQILVPLLADKGLYCRLPVKSKEFCLMASGGFSITVDVASGLAPNYVLALLNSRLLFWRLRSISNVFRGGWVTCTKQYVETLPIRMINWVDLLEKGHYDQSVGLAEQILDLHKRLVASEDAGEQQRLQRLIDATDQQIDALVYELYGLTAEEIAIVEGGEEK